MSGARSRGEIVIGSRAPLVATASLVIATAITFSALFSTTDLPTYRDLLFFTWPLKHFLHERLLEGRLPLWNPLLLMGTPYLANLQSGVFYPPSLLLLLPLPLGFNLFLLAHYLIALAGASAWLRFRGLDAIPAAVGSAVFALGGYMVSLLNLTNHLQAAVWAPWVFFCWGRFCEKPQARNFLWLVLALSLELLGGSPENLLLTLVAVAAWTAYDSFAALPNMARRLSYLAFGVMAATGVCAVQVLPTLEYAAQSVRAGALSLANVAHYSFQPVSVLQLALPHSSSLLPADAANSLGPSFEADVPLIESYYLGIAPLCLAIVGMVAGRERLLWTLVVAAGVTLALGAHTPIFPLLYHWLPALFGKFRYPEKFYFLVHLGASVLAAEGARLVLARERAPARIVLVAIATLASILLAVCMLRWLSPSTYLNLIAALAGRYRAPIAFVPLALDTYWKVERAILLLAVLAALLVLRNDALRPALSAGLLLGLVLVDLVSANRNLNQGMSWPALAARPPLVDPAEARARGERIFNGQVVDSFDGDNGQPISRLQWFVPSITRSEDLAASYGLLWETMNSDAGMVYGLANVSGSDGMATVSDSLLQRVIGELPVERAVKLLGVFGAGYILGPGPLPARNVIEMGVDHETPYRAFKVHDRLPLVFAVSRLRVEPSLSTALVALSRDDFDPTHEAIVESEPPGWRSDEEHRAPLVSMLDRADDRWRFRVDGTTASFVVVNESFFPGWKADVDGSPVAIVRTNGLVRGIVVPAGNHLVEFAYRPKSFRYGATVSVACLFVFTCGTLMSAKSVRGAMLIAFTGATAIYDTCPPVADNDLWGHVYFGRLILESGLPGANQFSYTAPNHPWVNHETLAECVLAFVFDHFGGSGLLVLKLVVGSAAFAFALRTIARRTGSVAAAALSIAVCGSLVSHGFLIRPQIFTFLFLAVLWERIHAYDETRDWRLLAVVPPLFLVWTNTHGGVAAGLGIFLAYAAARAISGARASERSALVVIALLSTIALFGNPYGMELPAFLWRDLGRTRSISEWQPFPLFASSSLLCEATIAILVIGAFMRIARTWEIAVLAAAAVMTFRHQRHLPLFAILAAPALAETLDGIGRGVRKLIGLTSVSAHARAAVFATLAAVSFFEMSRVVEMYRAVRFQIFVPPDLFPVDAVRFLERNALAGNLAVQSDWGEYAIWHLYPACRVSFDGRYTTAYPDEVIDLSERFQAGAAGWQAVLDRADLALLDRQQRSVVAALFHDPAWQYLYSDPTALVFARKTLLGSRTFIRDARAPTDDGLYFP